MTASWRNRRLYVSIRSCTASSFSRVASCPSWSMYEASCLSAPVEVVHCPEAVQDVSPSGKWGVTVSRRKLSHSWALTTPPGLTVPKYSESSTIGCSCGGQVIGCVEVQPTMAARRRGNGFNRMIIGYWSYERTFVASRVARAVTVLTWSSSENWKFWGRCQFPYRCPSPV